MSSNKPLAQAGKAQPVTPDPPIRWLGSHVVYQSPWMTLRVDDVVLSNGFVSEYGIVERHPFVLIIPRCDDRFLLVRQYRYPIKQWTLEFPQGAMDPNETVSEAARRELQEETGYTASCVRSLTVLYEAAGFATHHCHVVEACVEAKLEARPEISEVGITPFWTTLKHLQELVHLGHMQDAPSLAALAVVLLNDQSTV